MKSAICLWSLIAAILLIALGGCEVTSEKIGVWKQSENGAPKLRAALRDRRQKLSIRVEAAEALCEVGLLAPLSEDIKAVTTASEQDEVVKAVTTSKQDEGVTVVLPRALWAQVRDFAANHPLRPSARRMLAVIVQDGLKVAADGIKGYPLSARR